VKQVTINPKRIREIVDMGKMRQITNTLEQSRKEARKINNSLFIEEKDNDLPNFKPRGNLFGDDDTPELNGGKTKKANKKSKRIKNKKSKKANKKSKRIKNKKSKRIKNKKSKRTNKKLKL
jgi:Tfp pilus assembly protein FimT